MNSNIKQLIKEDFYGFLALIKLGIIDKEDACDFIIEFNNAEYIYNFAYDIENANIRKLENAIIKTKNLQYIFAFARDIKESNIFILEEAVIKMDNGEYIYQFALNVKNADISRLENTIIKMQNIEYIKKFAFNVKGVNIKKLRRAIADIENHNNQSIDLNILSDYDYLMVLLKARNYAKIEKEKKKYSVLFKNENTRIRTLRP